MHGAKRRLEPVLRKLGGFCLSTDEADNDPFASAPGRPRLPLAYAKASRMYHALRINQFASFSD